WLRGRGTRKFARKVAIRRKVSVKLGPIARCISRGRRAFLDRAPRGLDRRLGANVLGPTSWAQRLGPAPRAHRLGPSASAPAPRPQRLGPSASGPAPRAQRLGPSALGPASWAQRLGPSVLGQAPRGQRIDMRCVALTDVVPSTPAAK